MVTGEHVLKYRKIFLKYKKWEVTEMKSATDYYPSDEKSSKIGKLDETSADFSMKISSVAARVERNVGKK